jgi:hypothetical protein
MGDLLQPWHLLILSLVFIPFLIPAIFYLLTLQKTLARCAPNARTMEPGMVWLGLVPLVNLVFHFFIVFAIAKSLRNEFNRRAIPVADPLPGQNIGLAMCICACFAVIPVVGVAALVLWIVYWVKIAEYSRMLDVPVPMGIRA